MNKKIGGKGRNRVTQAPARPASLTSRLLSQHVPNTEPIPQPQYAPERLGARAQRRKNGDRNPAPVTSIATETDSIREGMKRLRHGSIFGMGRLTPNTVGVFARMAEEMREFMRQVHDSRVLMLPMEMSGRDVLRRMPHLDTENSSVQAATSDRLIARLDERAIAELAADISNMARGVVRLDSLGGGFDAPRAPGATIQLRGAFDGKPEFPIALKLARELGAKIPADATSFTTRDLADAGISHQEFMQKLKIRVAAARTNPVKIIKRHIRTMAGIPVVDALNELGEVIRIPAPTGNLDQ